MITRIYRYKIREGCEENFHAASRRQVDEVTAKLRERGAVILYADRHPHAGGPDSYAVFFEDPERVKVELSVSGEIC